MVLPDSSVGKESSWNAGDPGLIPGSGRSSREGIGYPLQYSWVSLVALQVKSPPAMWETWVRSLFPGLGRSPGERKDYPLQCSCLENSMDCIVHGVTKNQTRLSDFHAIHKTAMEVMAQQFKISAAVLYFTWHKEL